MSAYAAENRLRRWFTGEEHTNMKLTIPSNAEKILHILEENGYEAYVVGGCVRDSILGRNPNDWDITTSASPQQVKELFQRTVDTGLQHGTVTVLMDKEGYEVTTYRVDGDYEDGRHPKQVMFTSSLEEDLKRTRLCSRWWIINRCFSQTAAQSPLLKAKADREIPWINQVAAHSGGHAAVIPWKQSEIKGKVLETL